jgi:magnesium chelatase family protein
VDYTNGFPGMTIVGLPEAAVQESRKRVQAAGKNAGLGFPGKRVIVNLASASIHKEGLYYDLPIALAVLVHFGALKPSDVEGTLVVGESSLDGAVRHERGALPMPAVARRLKFKRRVVLQAGAAEAALIPNLEVIPVPCWQDSSVT